MMKNERKQLTKKFPYFAYHTHHSFEKYVTDNEQD